MILNKILSALRPSGFRFQLLIPVLEILFRREHIYRLSVVTKILIN